MWPVHSSPPSLLAGWLPVLSLAGLLVCPHVAVHCSTPLGLALGALAAGARRRLAPLRGRRPCVSAMCVHSRPGPTLAWSEPSPSRAIDPVRGQPLARRKLHQPPVRHPPRSRRKQPPVLGPETAAWPPSETELTRLTPKHALAGPIARLMQRPPVHDERNDRDRRNHRSRVAVGIVSEVVRVPNRDDASTAVHHRRPT